ncbi:glycosyltransferase family 1 protein [Candidatus Atribacteria bacterium 1244-E10-H5-B2]|nr:MAG: glycosyltransferase family 1 protein [Candidatus Atribacteria bacterium 1244-E10-H5-B2]
MVKINNLDKKQYKIAIIAPTPFYYHVPLYQQLTNSPEIDLTVFYCSKETLRGREVEKSYQAKGKIVNEAELLDGYNYKFLKNYSLFPSYLRWPFGLINFGIWEEIKNGKFDAVTLQSWANLTWWLAFSACLKFNTPILFMTDSNILSVSLKSKWRRKLKEILLGRFIFKRVAGFITSGTTNEQFYKAYGVPEEKMIRLYFSCGYEGVLAKANKLKPQRENLRASFGIKEKDFVLLYVGRLSEEKLLFTLLDAYYQVNYQNKKLFLVGDGPLRSRLEKYAEKLNLKEIYFMGFLPREKVFKFYTIADVFILPSGDETWGIVVNEAMCFGLPIITSNRVGSAVDLVKDGYNGFIFPSGDDGKLTDYIEKLIRLSTKERLLFGQRSIDIIIEWIKKIDQAQQMLKMLESLRI